MCARETLIAERASGQVAGGVAPLFRDGVLLKGQLESAAVFSALDALDAGQIQTAVSHAWAARTLNPLRSEYFGLLIKAFEAAGVDDLAFKTLEHQIASKAVSTATYQKYLSRLKERSDPSFEQALQQALPLLKAQRFNETLALVEGADLSCLGACWRGKDSIHLWIPNPPRGGESTVIKLHWFGQDKWTVQTVQVGHGTGKEAIVLKLPWRKGMEACTLRVGPEAEILPGSPLFGEVALSPAPAPRAVDNTADTHPIDVIIPIYKGVGDTKACLNSVISAARERTLSVTMIADRPPEKELQALLDSYRFEPNVTILKNAENLGFTASVNRGLRRALAGGRDVVLLNADTIVPDGWLDHLHRVAYADDRIGTVTPLTNNGEIVSFPRREKAAPLPDGLNTDEVSTAAQEANGDQVIDIPTAVGFCMFIKAKCLREIGFLDAFRFGKGYGEEIDFCMRARQAGWRNVCATGLFVTHAASVSFGDEKQDLVRQNMPRVNKRYPEYGALMRRFLQTEPLKEAFHRLDRLLLHRRMPQPTALVIAPSDWHKSPLLEPLMEQFEAEGIEALFLSVDPNRPQKITLAAPEGGGAGALQYDCEADAADLVSDLKRLPLAQLHWAHAPDLNIGMQALRAELLALPGLHHVQLLTAQILRWAAEEKALQAQAVAVPYSEFGKGWTEDHQFEMVAAPALPPFQPAQEAPERSTQTDVLGIAVSGNIAYGSEYEQLLALARLTAAQELPLRYYIFEKTVNDMALARTGHVVNLGGVDTRDFARMREILSFRYALDLGQETDPAGLALCETAKMAPGLICFAGGCREDLTRDHPDAQLLPKEADTRDILVLLKSCLAAH